MAAQWERLKTTEWPERCASGSHDGYMPATWRMESGNIGSYYCDDCRRKIVDRANRYTEAHEPHEDQLQAWADEVAENLLPWLADFDSYDDKIAFFEALKTDLAHIAEAAHSAGMARARREPSSQPATKI